MTKHTTTITIKNETKKMLDKIGKKNESYDDVIRKLLGKRRLA